MGALTHPAALRHDAGRGHPERPERLGAVLAHLRDSGLWARLEWEEPEPAERAWLQAVHEPEYLDELERLDALGGAQLDADTRMGPGSLEAALRASGAAVQAARRVLEGGWSAALVLMRPPGHHATPRRAMGFCLLNHVAVAARWALRTGRARRVLVVDWDAHHGNGTQEIFWTDPDVLYASLHQYPYYPGTGALEEVGAGAGEGRTLNVPLPAGAGEDAYAQALRGVLIPVAREFDPDLTLVSAGYDAHARDPLCMLRLSAGSYFRFARCLDGLGAGPVCVLEGGYDPEALAWCVAATASALLGEDEPVGVPGQEVAPTVGAPAALRWVQQAEARWGRPRP